MTDPVKLNLELTLDEVNGIIGALGELPAKTNAMALIQKIQTQVVPQLPKPEEDKNGAAQC